MIVFTQLKIPKIIKKIIIKPKIKNKILIRSKDQKVSLLSKNLNNRNNNNKKDNHKKVILIKNCKKKML